MNRSTHGTWARLFSAAFGISLCCAAAAQAQPGPWSQGTTGPAARYRIGGTSDAAQYIYVYGGGTSTGTLVNELWRWDWTTETWTQLANMPTAKQNIQGSYWNGKIYVPGGFTTVHLTENAIYDIASNTWSVGAPIPVARSGQTVAFNNQIFVFGGNPGPSNETRIYDIASNTWSLGAPMPVATTYGRAIAVGGFAYYVGGIAGATTNAVHRYDLVGNTWTTLAPLQVARTSAELMTDGSRIYAVNGGGTAFFTGVPLAQTVEIYDIAGNSWSFGQPTLTTTAGPAGGLVPGPGGKFMIMGGVSGVTYYNETQVSVNTTPVELMNFSIE